MDLYRGFSAYVLIKCCQLCASCKYKCILCYCFSFKSFHIEQKRRGSGTAGRSPGQIPQDIVRITDFNFLSVLGKGSFGKVRFSSQITEAIDSGIIPIDEILSWLVFSLDVIGCLTNNKKKREVVKVNA